MFLKQTIAVYTSTSYLSLKFYNTKCYIERAAKAAQTRKKKIKQFTRHDRYCQENKMCVKLPAMLKYLMTTMHAVHTY